MKKNKDFFLSSYLNRECFIVSNIFTLNKILNKINKKKDYFITIKSNKKLSKKMILENKLKFISELYFFKYNPSQNKKINIDKNIIFIKAKKNDWSIIKKIIPKIGTSRIFQDTKFKKKLREMYLLSWIRNFFLGKRGDDLIICKNRNNQILGFALLRKIKNQVIVDQLLVSKLAQGQGIGSQLLKVINTKFIKMPSISGVHSFNEGGVKFYSSKLKCKVIKKIYYYHLHKK